MSEASYQVLLPGVGTSSSRGTQGPPTAWDVSLGLSARGVAHIFQKSGVGGSCLLPGRPF